MLVGWPDAREVYIQKMVDNTVKKESSQRIPWSIDVAIVALQKLTFHSHLSRAHKICRRSGHGVGKLNR